MSGYADAARFASRLDEDDPTNSPIVRAHRNAGCRHAVRLMVLGHRPLALSILCASVEKQARLIGLRDVHLPRGSG